MQVKLLKVELLSQRIWALVVLMETVWFPSIKVRTDVATNHL